MNPAFHETDQRIDPIRASFLLVLITLVTFWQVRECEFINFDDNAYIYDNPNIRDGLTWKSIGWAFSADLWRDSPNADYWQPITFLSRIMDIQLFDLNAPMHHLINLGFHAANVLLLFHVLRRMTTTGPPPTTAGLPPRSGGGWQDGAVKRSAAVAALFAIHPLQVESVAWVTERKDVLSGFFWMLSLWGYLRYVEAPGWRRYVGLMVLFALGLMSKPMVVTLPFVLLLLDFWPLRRRPIVPAGRTAGRAGRWSMDKPGKARLLLEKMPLLALSLASVVMTLPRQNLVLVHNSASDALRNAANAYSTYCWKIIYPHELAIRYPRLGLDLSVAQVVGACVFLAACTLGVARWNRKCPYLLVGWLWFVVTLAPVVALNDIVTADRFTYLPCIGLFIAAAWGAPELFGGWRWRWIVLHAGFGAALALLMMSSWIQTGYWRSSITVFERALEVTSNNAVAHLYYGNALVDQWNLKEGIGHFREALRIYEQAPVARPDFINLQDVRAHFSLANALAKQKKFDEAIGHYMRVLQIYPVFKRTHHHLANSLVSCGRLNEAVAHYEHDLASEPDHVETHYNLGNTLAKQNKMSEAIRHYERVLQIDPGFERVHNNLANALFQRGRFPEAIGHYYRALRANPNHIEARYNLGVCLGKQGKTDEAVACMKRILEQQPGFAPAQRALADFGSRNGNTPRESSNHKDRFP